MTEEDNDRTGVALEVGDRPESLCIEKRHDAQTPSLPNRRRKTCDIAAAERGSVWVLSAIDQLDAMFILLLNSSAYMAGLPLGFSFRVQRKTKSRLGWMGREKC